MKYRPKTFSDMVGQDKQIEEVKTYFKNFPKVKKKAILLTGYPGVGKTTLVEVLAKETNSEIFELNASDFRSKKLMHEKLLPVLEQTSLFKQNKIILIDEIDGLSGMKDRGGASELALLLEKSQFPIICTANDADSKKLKPIKKKCLVIELLEISPSVVKTVLKSILEKENKQVTLKVLNDIAINSRGDLRSAINDLESVAVKDNPEEIEIAKRFKKDDIFNVLRTVFQEKADNQMLRVYDSVDIGLDEIMLWIEENITKVYSGKELAKAYVRLAQADLFKGRIYRRQYWRFLVYENIFLSYGIAQSKGDIRKTGTYKYTKPGRILKIWLNNVKHAKRKTIAQKYAKMTHVGMKRIMSEWREVKNILKNPTVQVELKLTTDEIAYIMKY